MQELELCSYINLIDRCFNYNILFVENLPERTAEIFFVLFGLNALQPHHVGINHCNIAEWHSQCLDFYTDVS